MKLKIVRLEFVKFIIALDSDITAEHHIVRAFLIRI